MSLQALVLCSDEKIVRVLRRVLSDLEVAVQHCRNAETAIGHLTRKRFEAVIVDCEDAQTAAEVLKSLRLAPGNKRAVAVAIIGGQTGLRAAFEMGAHFVLYKPVSMERAKVSFRAAHSLMKRERRRNLRIPIQIPVRFGRGQTAMTIDLSEGGLAVQVPRKSIQGDLRLSFTIPDSDAVITADAQVAWESNTGQTGVRFVDLPSESRQQLKAWLNRNAPEAEKDDPPASCRLTDLSLGGCYLEINAPFPVQSRVVLSMRVADLSVQVEGVVRVMHPEAGMGVEFTQRTPQQRQQVEKFIEALMHSQGVLPDLLVEPDGLETESGNRVAVGEEAEDPLLELFRNRAELPAEAFLGELRKQRRSQGSGSAETVLDM
jgi:CheY-like chemotaxis protein